MIYYLFSSDNFKKSIIEHIEFDINESKLKELLDTCKSISDNLNYDISSLFEYDSNVIDKIKNNLPLVASIFEVEDINLVTD